MERINYNHLYYFYTVGKHGGVTNAAKALEISQPSLSSQLKILGENLGVILFKQEGRKLKLTERGLEIFAIASSIFSFEEELLENIGKKREVKARSRTITENEFDYYTNLLQIDQPLLKEKIFNQASA